MWNILNIWVAFQQMIEDVLVKLNVGLQWLKLHSTRRGLFFTSTLDLELRKKLVQCYVWSIDLHGAET
jgi:hypothetical protein